VSGIDKKQDDDEFTASVGTKDDTEGSIATRKRRAKRQKIQMS
jgi:hypothetical protein